MQRIRTPYLLCIVFVLLRFYLIAAYFLLLSIIDNSTDITTTPYHFFGTFRCIFGGVDTIISSHWNNIRTNEKEERNEERENERKVNTWLSVCNSFKSFTITRFVEQTIRAINSYIPLFRISHSVNASCYFLDTLLLIVAVWRCLS